MLHIWAGDVAIGNTYDGTWNLSAALTTGKELEFTFVDDQPIPYIYAGANGVRVDTADDGAAGITNNFTIAFSQLSTARDDPATAASMLTDINNEFLISAPTITVTALVFNVATNNFDITLNPPASTITWDWGHVATTARALFGYANAALNTDLSWNATYADPRPPVMEVVIAEAKNIIKSSRASLATMVVNISDTHLSSVNKLLLTGTVESLGITWCRCIAPGVPVPMNNDWHLKFVAA